MKLNVGETIEVGGEEGIVCFSTIYNNINYVCIAFEEDKPRYEIYKCKFEEEKLLIAKVEDKDEADPVLKMFIEECIDEMGLPEELEKIFNRIEE